MSYSLCWVTGSIAVGMAPMSYDALDRIKAEGVTCILNLCAEYCDLHWIEAGEGFEVYYLPIPDESAPDLAALDKALDWLDEAVHLGKKALIHCRHGIGRTGTVMTAYLLRRGLSRKMAAQRLKRAKVGPANFDQWWFLRKFSKKVGALTIREPSLEMDVQVDLAPFFARHEALLEEIDARLAAAGATSACGADHSGCCRNLVELTLVEAAHLTRSIDFFLAGGERAACVQRAAEAARRARTVLAAPGEGTPGERYRRADILCPLNEYDSCLVFDHRPPACRLADLPLGARDADQEWSRRLADASADLARAFAPRAGPACAARFSLPEVVSGRWVTTVFDQMFKCEKENVALDESRGS